MEVDATDRANPSDYHGYCRLSGVLETSRFMRFPEKVSILHRKTKKRLCIITPCVALLLLLIGWIWWGNGAIERTYITLCSSKLPDGFSGFTIAHVSDLHNAEFGPENENLLTWLEASEPDMIAVTGDLIDSRHTDMAIALHFMERAGQIAPVYYVTGNHEARVPEYPQFKRQLKEAGVHILEDTGVWLEHNGDAIWLVGMDDPDFHVYADSADPILQELVRQGEYTILLSHRPELMDSYAQNQVDLVLCGHAHGGQIRLPGIGGLIAPDQGWFPKYTDGMYQSGQTQMVVSRGLGNSLFPFRVNNRPQLIILTLLNA